MSSAKEKNKAEDKTTKNKRFRKNESIDKSSRNISVHKKTDDLASQSGQFKNKITPLFNLEKILSEKPIVGVSSSKIDDISIAFPETLVPKFSYAPGDKINYELSQDQKKLIPLEKVGKVRVRFIEKNGNPIAGAQIRVVARTYESGNLILRDLASIATDSVGYGSVDLSYINARDLKGLILVPKLDVTNSDEETKNGFDILESQISSKRDSGLPHELFVPDDLKEHLKILPSGVGGVSIDFLDAADLRNSPASFDQSITNIGQECTLSLAKNLATRQFFFNQIVRVDTPKLIVKLDYYMGIDGTTSFSNEVKRDELGNPMDFEEEAHNTIQAGQPVLGKLNQYRQAWMPMGH